MMLLASSRVSYVTTSTSGFSACSVCLRRVDLALTDAVDVVQDLALQVRRVDLVHVDDADRADTGRRQVQRRRRAEPAGAEQEHLRAEQLGLTLDADLGQQQVALVTVLLLGGERDRRVTTGGPRPSNGRSHPSIETTSV